MTDRNKITTASVDVLLEIERQSGLSTSDFWYALLRLAKNDTLLRVALGDSRFQADTTSPLAASKPIVTSSPDFVMETPR